MKRAISIIFSFAIISFFAYGLPVFAQVTSGETTCEEGAVCLENPLKADSFQTLIGVIINNLMGIVGSIALLMFIAGGFMWLTSAGSAAKVKKGKDIIIWSALGMALIFSSYALVRFILEIAK